MDIPRESQNPTQLDPTVGDKIVDDERRHHHREHKSKHKHKKHHRHRHNDSRSPNGDDKDLSYESERRRKHRKKDHKHKKHHKSSRRRDSQSPKSPHSRSRSREKAQVSEVNPVVEGPSGEKRPFSEMIKTDSQQNTDVQQPAADSNNPNLLVEHEWDKATANREFIFIPGQPPRRRKHKNVWSDANEQDIAR